MENDYAATENETMKRAYLTLLAITFVVVPVLGQTSQKTASINRKVVGKWVSADRKSYIEFSADGSCSTGELGNDGAWHVDHNVLDAPWSQTDDFTCGSGALELIGPNTLTRDFGMGGEPEKFYRGAGNLPQPAGPLTASIAQRVLNQQIDQTTVQNTLLTCRACYDADDKEDNDRAPVVSTYSAPLSQFLVTQGYIRVDGDREVFTAKAKRSKYYGYNDGAPGFRFASFKNAHVLSINITDSNRVPIEYELAPTEITIGFFGKFQSVRSFASFSYQNEAWQVCIACRR
jgi:hypothetical protein